ncbi:MAG: glycosyltransferase family 39 protein [bacterium]|nr:glycosyltransferase family 39 protein [bacterium]
MKYKFAAIAILILLFFGYVYPYDYGYPRIYIQDVQMVRQAFKLCEGFVHNPSDILKEPSKYPLFLSLVLSFFYGIVYLAGILFKSGFGNVNEFLVFAVNNISVFYIIANICIAVSAIIAVYYTYRVVSEECSDRAGIFAMIFSGTSLLFWQYAHQARPHIPMAMFAVMTWFYSVSILKRGERNDYLKAGLFSGLAFCVLQSGLLVLSIPVTAHLLRFKRGAAKLFAGPLLWCAGVFIAVSFIIGYPYLLFSFFDSVGGRGGTFDITLSGGYHDAFEFGFHGMGFAEIAKGFFGYDPALSLIALAGIIYFLVFSGGKNEKEKKLFSPVIPFAIIFITVFGMYDKTYRRFQMPLIPLMGAVAACYINAMLLSLKGKHRKAFAGVIAILLIFSAAQCLRYNWILANGDTRDDASVWITEHIPDGTAVITEKHCPEFAYTLASIQDNISNDPASLGDRDKTRLRENIVLKPEYSFYKYDFWKNLPVEELVEKKGIQYIFLYRQFDKDRNDPLYKYAKKQAAPVYAVTPSNGAPFFYEAMIPGEVRFSIFALWSVRKAGPIIEIYRVGEND